MGSSGSRVSPAPTWPTPAVRCARPLLTIGAMPVSCTRATSMPIGVPTNPSDGMSQRVLVPRVTWRSSSTSLGDRVGSPPVKRLSAGAATSAKAPSPTTSVM